MIDKYELLRWVDWMEGVMDNSGHSEEAKEVHYGYMDLFRNHINEMPEKRVSCNEMTIGIVIGAVAEVVVIVLCSMLF